MHAKEEKENERKIETEWQQTVSRLRNRIFANITTCENSAKISIFNLKFVLVFVWLFQSVARCRSHSLPPSYLFRFFALRTHPTANVWLSCSKFPNEKWQRQKSNHFYIHTKVDRETERTRDGKRVRGREKNDRDKEKEPKIKRKEEENKRNGNM